MAIIQSSNGVRVIICSPHDLYFCAEVECQLNNLRQFGYTQGMHILVYEDDKEERDRFREYWVKLMERYIEVSFYFYDNPGLKKMQTFYPQISRPFMLSKHWELHPYLQHEVILYIDSDVILSKPIDWKPLLQDNICYLSKTNYIGAKYFENKSKDVLFHKKAEYTQRDILGECCRIAGIDKQLVIDNENISGGCQYLLKNIDSNFWKEVMELCIQIRLYLMEINRQFFMSEEKGFQSWCADMWAMLWLLWKRGTVTACPEVMAFSWASDPIENYSKHAFFHNAGVSGKIFEKDGVKHRMFHKADLRLRTSSIAVFDITDWGELSQDYCSYMYVKAIEDVKDPICRTTKTHY